MKKLTKSEKELLRKYFQKSPVSLIRLKSQAVLMKNKGYTHKQIAEVLLRTERSIERWMSDFNERRIASIFSGHVDNENAAKLTREQKKEISEVLSKPPSEEGLPVSFWDVPELKKYVKAEFGVAYESDTSYHYLLHFSDLSFKYPDRFDKKRDEKQIARRMKEIYAEVAPLMKSSRWEVFFGDEVGLQLKSLTRKAWLKKGEKTIVKMEKSRVQQNFVGYLNQKSGKCDLFKIESGNEEEMIRTLTLLTKRYPEKRICIIWDNATCHKSKALRAQLGKGGALEKVHLIPLPPYAPDHNPIEKVWNEGKDKAATFIDKSLETITNSFIRHIAHRKFDFFTF